ncbi:MAG: hypothetical protein R3F17_08050 [Planctomycetota bacterium]
MLFGTYLVLWSFFVANSLMSAAGISLQAMWPLFDKPVDGQLWFGIASSLLGVPCGSEGFAVFEKVSCGCLYRHHVHRGDRHRDRTKLDLGSSCMAPFVPSISAAADPRLLKWTVALMGHRGTLTVLLRLLDPRKGPRRRGVPSTAAASIYEWLHHDDDLRPGDGVIGTKIEVHGKGASLIVDLANELEKPWPAGPPGLLLGSSGAIFSSLLGVCNPCPTSSDYPAYCTPAAAKPRPPCTPGAVPTAATSGPSP